MIKYVIYLLEGTLQSTPDEVVLNTSESSVYAGPNCAAKQVERVIFFVCMKKKNIRGKLRKSHLYDAALVPKKLYQSEINHHFVGGLGFGGFKSLLRHGNPTAGLELSSLRTFIC